MGGGGRQSRDFGRVFFARRAPSLPASKGQVQSRECRLARGARVVGGAEGRRGGWKRGVKGGGCRRASSVRPAALICCRRVHNLSRGRPGGGGRGAAGSSRNKGIPSGRGRVGTCGRRIRPSYFARPRG